jgi:hypothetical protein
MLRQGFYAITYATMQGAGSVNLRLDGRALTGITDRATVLEGWCRYNTSRQLVQFELTAVLPPHVVAVTGITIGAEPRRINFKGEAPGLSSGTSRFSIDFAGRAVDVVARYTGPLDDQTL